MHRDIQIKKNWDGWLLDTSLDSGSSTKILEIIFYRNLDTLAQQGMQISSDFVANPMLNNLDF